ncbi:MAG: hypothetical protein JO056_09535 [Alphaproteobacteria bacterium]|nr:hypothetical protein [Alphaproteobacteria bacterium]
MGQPAGRKDHSAFLAELAAALQESQARPGVSAEERGRHARWLEHAQALSELFGADATGSAGATTPEHALPPALLKELSPRKRDQLEQQIVAVLAASDGSADLDHILIGLYRGYGVIAKRRVIQNKLWRLVRTGRIRKAKNTRNVFALNAPKERRSKRKR